jgi:hypothetical protein
MKIKSTWIKFLLLTISAIIIGQVVSSVVTKNLYDYVYPMEADSISIPILSTYLMFIVLLPFAISFSFLSISKYEEPNQKISFWFVSKLVLYIISYIVLALTAISGCLYWNTSYPNHNFISLSYIGLVALIHGILIFDLHKIYTAKKYLINEKIK